MKEINLIGKDYLMPSWAKDRKTGVRVYLGNYSRGTIVSPNPKRKFRLFQPSILTILVEYGVDGRIYECEYIPGFISYGKR